MIRYTRRSGISCHHTKLRECEAVRRCYRAGYKSPPASPAHLFYFSQTPMDAYGLKGAPKVPEPRSGHVAVLDHTEAYMSVSLSSRCSSLLLKLLLSAAHLCTHLYSTTVHEGMCTADSPQIRRIKPFLNSGGFTSGSVSEVSCISKAGLKPSSAHRLSLLNVYPRWI